MSKEKIFADWAPRYHEAGLAVIPLNGKIPAIRDWSVWSTRDQTEEELDALIEEYPYHNIGVVLGKISALDIDTDDDTVSRAIPYSGLRRVGKKGSISIFKSSSMPNIPGTKYPIEFLNVGRQIVVPPSIHPDTGKPYNWIGEDEIFHIDLAGLPEITKAQFDQLCKVCERKKIYSESYEKRQSQLEGENPARLSDMGRNNKLTSMAYAMACDLVSEPEAVDRLLEFDKKEHATAWFSDTKEPHRGRNPKASSTRMYKRAVVASLKRGDRIEAKDVVVVSPQTTPTALYPAPRGFMKMFVEYCNIVSPGAQDALALGASISLMAALCSNRFKTKTRAFDVWPNMMIINVAFSGFGKDTSQNLISELLADSTLMGSAAYKSGTSVVMHLPEQQERLDIIDEVSALLKAMTAREDYKSEIVEVLSTLYSKSSSRYMGMASRAEGRDFGACWNPCVNILGSTTPQGFRSSVNKDMAAKGLLPRFLLFWQKDVGKFKRKFDAERAAALKSQLLKHTRIMLSHPKPVHPDSQQEVLIAEGVDKTKRYIPDEVPLTEAAQELLLDIEEKYHNIGALNGESFESAFQKRFAQQIAKLALLDALSQGLGEITIDSIEWAYAVVKAQWEGSRELYELAAAENETEKTAIRMLQFVETNKIVTASDLTRAFQGVPLVARKNFIQGLLDAECIAKVKIEKKTVGSPGPAAIGYQFIKGLRASRAPLIP